MTKMRGQCTDCSSAGFGAFADTLNLVCLNACESLKAIAKNTNGRTFCLQHKLEIYNSRRPVRTVQVLTQTGGNLGV